MKQHHKIWLLLSCAAGLTACLHEPVQPPVHQKPSAPVITPKPAEIVPEGIKITPYERPEIIRQSVPK